MKFCEKCGKELLGEGVFCPNCGSSNKPVNDTAAIQKSPASIAAIILGIIGIISAWLLAIVGHITSIIAIIIGIKDCINGKKPTGLILGIIGEVCAIISSIIGAVAMASIF